MAIYILVGGTVVYSYLQDDNLESEDSKRFRVWKFLVSDEVLTDPFEILRENYILWLSLFSVAFVLFYLQPGKRLFGFFKFYPNIFPENSLIFREIFRSARGVLIASIYEIIFSKMYLNGITPFFKTPFLILNKQSLELSIVEIIIVLLGVGFWGDTHFYWTHRILHLNKFLYKHVHKFHHESIHPNPYSGLSMHYVESAIYFSAAPMLALCCPYWMFRGALKGLIIFPIEGHVGYGIEGWTDHHDLHHAKFNWNFGGLPVWDYLMGTLLPPDNKHE